MSDGLLGACKTIGLVLALGVSMSAAKGEGEEMALYWAAMQGNYEAVTALIAHGADVNAREPLNGFTPLHQAVSYIGSSQPTLKQLTSNRPALQMLPMDVADSQNKKKVAELLIAHGADVNSRSKGGISGDPAGQ